MADRENTKGVRSKKDTVIVHPLPTRMENKRMSKEDFLERRRLDNEANVAAEAAKAKVLKEKGITKDESKQSEDIESVKKTISSLKSQIKETRDEVAQAPTSKKLKAKLDKLSGKLDLAEDKLDTLEV